MQSKATTVKQYLAELPADRRAAISAVRDVILKNLDKGYEEGMQYGMIGYYVPHSIFPDGYHCDPRQPLPFAGLASQKNHMSVYIMSTYVGGEECRWFEAAWKKTGRKLDMGKCCVRFKKLEDVALDVLGEAIRRWPVKKHIDFYVSNMRTANKKASAGKAKAAPTAKAKAATANAKSAKRTKAVKAKVSKKPAARKKTARAK
jgi:hypothetical protein